MSEPRINADRLWATIMETAAFGATPLGGVRRLALSEEDRQVRDWFVDACKAAGCEITIDTMGSIYAKRPGTNADAPPVACGSHLDTQPSGGKFDGILGVLAGLEVIRALNDAQVETAAPTMVINWTNEEGARFAPGLLASGVFAGVADQAEAFAVTDRDGVRFGDALAAIGYGGSVHPQAMELAAYYEMHIEQGPILEAEGKTIGIVEGAQGSRWYRIHVTGRDSHAGTTPMSMRRDAMQGAARLISSVASIALEHENAVGTVGIVEAGPGSINVVPGSARFTVDMRHPDDNVLAAMDRSLRSAAAELAEDRRLGVEVDQIWHSPPVAFDPACVGRVRDGAVAGGHSHREIVSGAGHDACYAARRVPTGMIFIPCEGGLSHNEKENARYEDVAAGADVLMRAMLATTAG